MKEQLSDAEDIINDFISFMKENVHQLLFSVRSKPSKS